MVGADKVAEACRMSRHQQDKNGQSITIRRSHAAVWQTLFYFSQTHHAFNLSVSLRCRFVRVRDDALEKIERFVINDEEETHVSGAPKSEH
jgi:hypothetical protein